MMRTLSVLFTVLLLLTTRAQADYLHCFCKALDLTPVHDAYGGILRNNSDLHVYGDIGAFTTPTACKNACVALVLGDSSLCSYMGGRTSGTKGADIAWDYMSFWSLHGSTPNYQWGNLNAALNDSYEAPQHGYYNQGTLTCSSGPGGMASGPGVIDSGPGGVTTGTGPGPGPGTGRSPGPGVVITGTSVGTTTTGGGVVLSGGGVSGTGVSGTGVTGSGVATSSSGVIVPYGGVTGSGGGGGPAPAACKNPEEGSPGDCKFIDAHHACDNGAGGGQASPVSSNVTGTSPAARFDSVVNKKLACCLNTQNKPIDPITKFDCIDNSKLPAITDFNSMWSKSDADTGVAGSGGQLFATVLSNAAGKPVTGFFTLDGARCNEFSEFGATGDIKTWKINPAIMAGQQNKATTSGGDVTGSIPIPTSSNYSTMKGIIKKGIPTTPAEMLRCPLLVRAYIVSKCDSDPAAPLMHTAYPFRPSKAPERCSSASSIQAHFRVEQWIEISGAPKLKTTDSVQDLSVQSISVSNIISKKNGTVCEHDSVLVGNLCQYEP